MLQQKPLYIIFKIVHLYLHINLYALNKVSQRLQFVNIFTVILVLKNTKLNTKLCIGRCLTHIIFRFNGYDITVLKLPVMAVYFLLNIHGCLQSVGIKI